MGKQKTKTVSKTGEAVGAKVGKARHEVVRAGILEAYQGIEDNYLALAKLLTEAVNKEFYIKWHFEDFKQYCEKELGVKFSKASYLVRIWNKVLLLGLPPKRVTKIGWSKMKELVDIINEKNVEEWLEKAEKLSSRELTAEVRVIRRKTGTDRRPTSTTLKIPMQEAEASVILEGIEEAKKLCETDDMAVALEMIVQDWMELKGASPERTSLEDHIQFLEKAYGVKITHKASKPPAKKKAEKKETKKAKEKEEKTEGTAEEEVDVEDLLQTEEGEEGKGSGDAETDLDELLGL